MKILIASLVVGLAIFTIAQTNGPPVPPPPDPPPGPYTVDHLGNTNSVPVYPFLLATGVDTNGQIILEAPPQWMLDGPPTNTGPKFIPLTVISSTNLTATNWTPAGLVIGIYTESEQEFLKLKIGEE